MSNAQLQQQANQSGLFGNVSNAQQQFLSNSNPFFFGNSIPHIPPSNNIFGGPMSSAQIQQQTNQSGLFGNLSNVQQPFNNMGPFGTIPTYQQYLPTQSFSFNNSYPKISNPHIN